MIDSRDIGGIVGAPALDPDGQKVGTVTQVLVDAVTGQPQWATVNPGLFSGSDAFVPLQRAEWDREHLLLPYTKDQLKDSPRFKIDEALAPAEQELLRRHYEPTQSDVTSGHGDAPDQGIATDQDIATDRDIAADRDGDTRHGAFRPDAAHDADDSPGRHAGPVI